MLALGVGGLLLCAALHAQTPPPADTQQAASTPQDLAAMLTDIRTPRETRLFVARALVASNDPARDEVIRSLLVPPQPPGTIEVLCQALAEAPDQAEPFLESLLRLLAQEDSDVWSWAVRPLERLDSPAAVKRFGELLSDASVPVIRRERLLNLLTRRLEHPAAVETLIALLQDPAEPIRRQAHAWLVRLAGQDLGTEPRNWQAWWQNWQNLPPARRLSAVLAMTRLQLRHALIERDDALQQMLSLSRRLYDCTPETSRPALLDEFLRDPRAAVRVLGLELVSARIHDRKRIPPEIAARARDLLADDDAAVRAAAIEVIRDLRNPDDAAVLLARLPHEPVPANRLALLNAVGWLGNPQALPLLIETIRREQDPRFVVEAADAIGRLVANGLPDAPPDLEAVLVDLADRLDALDPAQRDLRVRLLGALVAIADPRLVPTFRRYLASADDALRQKAVLGLARTGGADALPDLVRMLADPLSQIRLIAVQAIGEHGRDPDHVAALLPRLDPATEGDTVVREAAWKALRQVLARIPPEQRMTWIDRFDPAGKQPWATEERLATLLGDVEESLAAAQPESLLLAQVRRRLAETLIRLGRPGEALPRLRAALPVFAKADPAQAADLAARLVDVHLGVDPAGAANEAVRLIAQLPSARDAIEQRLTEFLQHALNGGTPAAVIAVIEALRAAPAETWSAAFRERLDATARAASDLRQALLRNQLNELLTVLRSGEAARVESAKAALVALGQDALPALVDALEATVREQPPDAATEAPLLEVVRALAPQWPGYLPTAPTEEKLKAIAALRATLTSRTATTSDTQPATP